MQRFLCERFRLIVYLQNKYGLFVEQEQTSGFECAGQEIISLHPAISVPQEKKSPSAAIK